MQDVLFQRRENPPLLNKYQNYKPYLRKDFDYRCAYCVIHEAHYGGLRNFHVDHFRPKSKFPKLARTYVNLYYACGLCNTFKSDHWPSAALLKKGSRYVDPCQEDPFGTHFEVDDRDGSLRTLTPAGKYTATHLRLDRRQLRKHRRRLAEKQAKCQELRDELAKPGVPPGVAARAQALLKEIEEDYLNPSPPFDLEDLEP